MPRMTPELLLSTPSYLNPLKDRELDLRGFQIPAIENLAVTKDSLDAIDLTDNAIRSLINLPKLNRLKHVYLSNNPLGFISPNLPQSLPNLNSLVLSNCKLNNFNQLFSILKQFRRLEFLVLTGNPVCKVKLYRDWCIYNCSKVRVLDYRRVKDKERKTALELFYDPTLKAPTSIALSLSVVENAGANPNDADLANSTSYSHSNVEPGQLGKTLTVEERDRIKRSIESASSVEEVRRLKRMLEQGFIPKEDRLPVAPRPVSSEPTETVIDQDHPPSGDVEMNEQNEEHAQEDIEVEPTTTKPTKKRATKATKPKAPARNSRSKTKATNEET